MSEKKTGQARLAFVDTETTGLYPRAGHEVYEIAIITQSEGREQFHQKTFLIRPDLSVADPMALKVGRYYERFGHLEWNQFDAPATAAREIANLLNGKTIVGAVPSFDIAMLEPFLRRNQQVGMWHYQSIDVETLIAGFLAAQGEDLATPSWDSNELSRKVGINPDDYVRHTAMGDAKWAMALYEKIMGVKFPTH